MAKKDTDILNPKYFKYNDILSDIDALRGIDMSGPDVNYDYWKGAPKDTFKMGDMQGAMDRLHTAPQYNFQSPDQLTGYIDAWKGAMQPYLDSSKQMAQQQYQQQLDNLRQDWSGRGLMQSPAAALNEQYAAGQYAQQLQHQQNQAMMEALGKSMDYARLGLDERSLGTQQNMAAVQAMLEALGMQEQQKMNVANVNRMMSQDEFMNWLDKTDLTIKQKQAVIDSMFRGAEMELGAQQGGLDYGLRRDQLGLQERKLANEQAMWEQELRERQRQFNFENALKWSDMFNEYVTPVESGKALESMLKGKQTGKGRAQDAEYTGYYGDVMTPLFQTIRSNISGIDPITGKPTMAAKQFEQEMAFRLQQLQQQMAIAQMNAAIARQRQEQQEPFAGMGEAFGSMIGDLYQNPPQTQEEFDRYVKLIDSMFGAGALTEQGASSFHKALSTYRAPYKKPSAFQKNLQNPPTADEYQQWLNKTPSSTRTSMWPMLFPGRGFANMINWQEKLLK